MNAINNMFFWFIFAFSLIMLSFVVFLGDVVIGKARGIVGTTLNATIGSDQGLEPVDKWGDFRSLLIDGSQIMAAMLIAAGIVSSLFSPNSFGGYVVNAFMLLIVSAVFLYIQSFFFSYLNASISGVEFDGVVFTLVAYPSWVADNFSLICLFFVLAELLSVVVLRAE